jgi:hypothetical protein
MTSSHDWVEREAEVEGSSNRPFGWVFAAFFLIVALLPFLFGGGGVRYWARAASAALADVTLARPTLLEVLNRLLRRFGLWVGRIVRPVMFPVIFYGAVTPIGLAMRLAGKDLLRLRRDPGAASYWIVRDPPGPPRESMSDQFLGESDVVHSRAVAVYAGAQEVLAAPDPSCRGPDGLANRAHAGHGGGALHPHPVLIRAGPGDLGFLPRQRGGAGARR